MFVLTLDYRRIFFHLYTLQKRAAFSTWYAILTSNRLSLGLDISELVRNHNANSLAPNE